MLKAGYLEDWEYHETLSGCPQGSVVSPILSNIYLHKLDEFIEQELIPQYTRGTSRKTIPNIKGCNASWQPRGGAGTGQQPGTWESNCAGSPPRTRWTPAIAASGI